MPLPKLLELSTPERQERMTGQGLRRGAAKVWQEEDWRAEPSLLRAARGKDWLYWTSGPLQDQGATPHCVEYSTRGLLEASPARNKTKTIPRGSIYGWCQKNDEWSGEADDGTSVHAAMKWLKQNSYIESYEWARTAEEAHAHLMTRGPLVIGTTWYEHMSYVDEFGYARISGANYGGHAYMIRGGNRNKKDPVTGVVGACKIRNSWGLEYGDKGESWINWKDFQDLIDDWGEIAMPIELKRHIYA
jgi:hypothetical protein